MHLVRGETEETLDKVSLNGPDKEVRIGVVEMFGVLFMLWGGAEVPSDTYSPPILKI